MSWQLATKIGKQKIGIVGKEICTRSRSTDQKKQSCIEFCIPRSGIFFVKDKKVDKFDVPLGPCVPKSLPMARARLRGLGLIGNEPQILGWTRIPDSCLTLCLEPI